MRLVKWIGDIDEKNFDRVLGEILGFVKESPDEPIILILSSKGGDTTVGFAFYDMMMAYKPKLITVGTGIVGSIAPIILAAGQSRLLSENTKLSFHNFFVKSNDAIINLEPGALIALGKEMNLGVTRYCKILADRSNGLISARKMKNIVCREATLTAAKAVELGLADTVLNPKDFKN